jgi:hypothetical protein
MFSLFGQDMFWSAALMATCQPPISTRLSISRQMGFPLGFISHVAHSWSLVILAFSLTLVASSKRWHKTWKQECQSCLVCYFLVFYDKEVQLSCKIFIFILQVEFQEHTPWSQLVPTCWSMWVFSSWCVQQMVAKNGSAFGCP